VTRNQNTGMAQRSKPPTVDTSLQGQLEERLRIAEHIIQALREAGYSCGLADKAYSLNGIDLPTAIIKRANAIYDKAHGRL
jgi:hypothetical protein